MMLPTLSAAFGASASSFFAAAVEPLRPSWKRFIGGAPARRVGDKAGGNLSVNASGWDNFLFVFKRNDILVRSAGRATSWGSRTSCGGDFTPSRIVSTSSISTSVISVWSLITCVRLFPAVVLSACSASFRAFGPHRDLRFFFGGTITSSAVVGDPKPTGGISAGGGGG